jgi:hypothetical protein
MEVSVLLLRQKLLSIATQTNGCEYRAFQALTSRSTSLRHTSRTATSIRAFSSSTQRCLEEVSGPDTKISDSQTHPSSPVQRSPKQTVEAYVSSVQKIIDGYSLGKKENLHPKLHSDMMVALSNAEARLNAPNAASESFDPLLKSLQGELSPVLRNRFGTTDVSQIIASIGQSPASQAEVTAAPPKQSDSIADLVDNAFAKPARTTSQIDTQARRDQIPKIDALRSFNSDSPPKTMRGAVLAPGTVSSAFERTDQAWYDMNQSKNSSRGPTLRLTSSLGKSVEIGGAFDLTRAFQRMEMICSRNSVRRDVARQRFHVRRGQLKKQLRMERWRRLFKEGFIAECSRVRRMRRQGW